MQHLHPAINLLDVCSKGIGFSILCERARTERLTIIIVYQFSELFPNQIPGCRGYERPPWNVDRGGCQREIGPTRANQPGGPTRRKKGWKRDGVETGREYYESSILVGGDESRAVTFRFGMETQRARSGQNNVKSALPTPRRNFRLAAQLVRPSTLFSPLSILSSGRYSPLAPSSPLDNTVIRRLL